ncbi:hypothetical protein GQ473_03150 [archaeon]|nr:hypothetical protein [archaeon]
MDKYRRVGFIKAPIRAWKNIQSAEKFSIQTGRQIIIRLKFPNNVEQLEGHGGNAVVIKDKPFILYL